MKSLLVVITVGILAGSLIGKATLAAAQSKAQNHAMEQERKAMEQAAKRQQELEKKLMEQQRHAMAEQLKAERKFLENQQRAYQQQQKEMLHHQNAQHHPGAGPAFSGQVYHAYRPYYGHHSYGHPHDRTSYRHYRQMPTTQDPETRALLALKQSLDQIRPGSPITPAEKSAIKNALMRVVEVPKVPTMAAITTLANDLANALANRASATAETGPMAVTLRGILNSTLLPNMDLNELVNEHRSALKASKVRPDEVVAVLASLKTISNQERAHR